MSGCCADFVPGTPDGGGGGGGGGSTIIVEAEGAPIAGNPFTTLDFVDVGIIPSDGGGGVAEIASNPPYVDLRFPPYNVVPDDSTAPVKLANSVAINQAIIDFSGTGATLALPQGDVYVDKMVGLTERWSIVFGTGISNLTFKGQGMFGTRLIQDGVGVVGQWDCIVIDGASNIELCDFTIMQGTLDNVDPAQQNHLIGVYNNTLGGTTEAIVGHDLFFGKCIGDAWRLLADNGDVDVVENIELRDSQMELHGIVNVASGRVGARSGIAIQRGFHDIRFIDLHIRGAQNSPLDFEPTGAPILVDGAYFENVRLDNSQGNTNSPCSVSGNAAQNLSNITLKGVTVLGGKFNTSYTTNLLLEDLVVETTVPPPAATGDALLQIRGTYSNLRIINPSVRRLGTSAAGRCIDSDGGVGDLYIEGGECVQNSGSYPLLLNGHSTLTIKDHTIRYTSGTSPAGIDVVLISVTDANCQPCVDGLVVRSTHATPFGSVVNFQVRAPRTLSNVQVVNCDAPNVGAIGVIVGHGVGAVFDASPLFIDNNWGTSQAWRVEDAGTNPLTDLYPITSGSKALLTARRLEGLVTPNGAVTGNLGDIYTWRPTTTSATQWFKASETVPGTPDNTGWVLDQGTGGAPLTPAVLAAGTTNDYDLTAAQALASTGRIRQATDAANSALSGMVPVVTDRQSWQLVNLGPGTLTLLHEDAGSAAANRYTLEGAVNRIIGVNGTVIIAYDTALTRWLCIG